MLVKHMIHNDTEKERAKKNLIYEAEVLHALGDHTRLPRYFGVITPSKPSCLVTQFHGINDQSITLKQQTLANLLHKIA